MLKNHFPKNEMFHLVTITKGTIGVLVVIPIVIIVVTNVTT